ncbi:MAG: hypothetical protein IJ037_00585 [Clostridia bacterium]|nr:hypothetical protein [Clostridia bacterium]MBQ8368384.1 hypothetical protein [Clostridia bacterium]MBQ8513530.1 hypothetical protein [Clostridia bacterium]
MKRILILLLSAALFLASCGTPGVYLLDDHLPELIDPSTQYPYTEKITVTQCSTGKVLEYTEGSDHDLIRMRLEGIRCIREKDTGALTPLYTIEFTTTDGTVTLHIASEYDYILDGYVYEAMRSSVDLLYFDGLFAE